MLDLLLVIAVTGTAVYLGMRFLSRKRDRELAQAKLGEARFRGLTELSADWFWETDEQHRVTWISGGAPVATFFGSTSTFGKRFWEIPGVEVDARALEALREGLGGQLPFFDLEMARTDNRGARQIHIIDDYRPNAHICVAGNR
jgi:PAS domain-containing protein